MPRYIDADALLKRLKRTPRYFDLKYDIEQMPTADVVDANKSIPVDVSEALKKRAMIEVARRIFVKITGALRYTRFASPLEKNSTLNYICALEKEYVEEGSPGIYGGAECPICHGTGEIGTSDWLTKHISAKQLAKEKAEAVAEYDRQLKAEAAREIFEEIEDVINNIGYFDELDFEALKKKYTGG